MTTNAQVPLHHGHRQRLKERFLKSPEALPDYEILELILYMIYPRRDMKPLAKSLLQAEGTLPAVLHASAERLEGHKAGSAFGVFRLIQEVSRRLLQEELRQAPLFNNAFKVVEYCRLTMAHLEAEQFRLFFLDKKYYLIKDEIHHIGTLDQTSLYPREVMKRALALNAAAIVLVHNHPSGDPAPSTADIEITRHLQASLLPFNVRVLDHFIIGKYGYFSFREHEMLSGGGL